MATKGEMFAGLTVAIITPFKEGQVDYDAVRKLVDLHIDLGYTKQSQQYRMFVDKQDQGRALILNDLLKDSNGELRLTFNTTGLAAGIYSIRIESLPVRASASPVPEAWLILDVR